MARRGHANLEPSMHTQLLSSLEEKGKPLPYTKVLTSLLAEEVGKINQHKFILGVP